MKKETLEFEMTRVNTFKAILDIDELKKPAVKPITMKLSLWRSKEDFLVLMEDAEKNNIIILPNARLLRKKSLVEGFINEWKAKNNLEIIDICNNKII